MNDRVKSIEEDDRECLHGANEEDERYAIDPRTGFEYSKRRPGERMITSEDVRKELEDFP